MSDNVTIEGEIDAGFKSYGVPKQDSSENNGNVETEYWPDELDKSDLTDKQRRVIEVAVANPTLTVNEVEKKAEVSNGYAGTVLRKFVPEWYDNVFKSEWAKKRDKARRENAQADQPTGESETTESQGETDTDTLSAVIGAMKATAQNDETIEALEVVENYL